MKHMRNSNKFLEWLDKHPNAIVISILSLIAAVLITIILIIFLPEREEKAPMPESYEQTIQTSSTLPADDTVDPENIEQDGEIGATVDAENITQSSDIIHGIDVSKWQGKIDWKKVKSDGIKFAIIRIGYRGENGTIYRDENADYNLQQAEKNGILTGVYFFSTARTKAEAASEANWTIETIKGYPISYPVVYDCEGFLNPASRMYNVTPTERGEYAAAFLNTVRKAGYDTMLYGAATELQDPYCWDLSLIEPNHKIWVARYPEVTYPNIKKPDYYGRCDAWQYTNQGSVNGISSNVDLVVSYFNADKAKPKDKNARPDTASTPLSEEEKQYKAVTDTVTPKETVNLRTSPSIKSKIAATVTNGTKINRIGIGSNGWSKLKFNGQTVYAITSYLTTDLTKTPTSSNNSSSASDGFAPTNDTVTAKDKTNLRSKPSTDSDVIYTLPNGEAVKRIGINKASGWSKLKFNGQTVYAITSYLTTDLTKTPTSSNSSSSASDGFAPTNDTVTAKDKTNLRSKPSTDSDVIYTLPNGEAVKRIGINKASGWSKLEYNGQTVYAITSYLTDNLDKTDTDTTSNN